MLSMPAYATNGMNAIAASSRSAGMGGADIGVATDHSAMNTNPAGITQYNLQVGATLNLLVPSLTISDQVETESSTIQLNQNTPSEEQTFPLIGVGITSAVTNQIYVGLGFYVQGGMGATFDNLASMGDNNDQEPIHTAPISTTYSTTSQVAFMKITPVIAYRLPLEDMTLSFGAAFNLGIAKMNFTHTGFQLPETDNDHTYIHHTLNYQSNNAVGYAGRIGVLAELLDGDFNIGAVYQSEAHIRLGGTTIVDQSLIYNNVEANFAWPSELGAGISFRPIRNLLIASDLHWINWSKTMKTFTLENQANPGTMHSDDERMDLPFYMNWSDQIVVAFGTEYTLVEELILRAGMNYGQNPVPADGITPFFPAISEIHYTGGFGISPIHGLRLDSAFEYVPSVTMTSNEENQMAFEPSLIREDTIPNGYQTEISMSQFSFHISANYAF